MKSAGELLVPERPPNWNPVLAGLAAAPKPPKAPPPLGAVAAAAVVVVVLGNPNGDAEGAVVVAAPKLKTGAAAVVVGNRELLPPPLVLPAEKLKPPVRETLGAGAVVVAGLAEKLNPPPPNGLAVVVLAAAPNGLAVVVLAGAAPNGLAVDPKALAVAVVVTGFAPPKPEPKGLAVVVLAEAALNGPAVVVVAAPKVNPPVDGAGAAVGGVKIDAAVVVFVVVDEENPKPGLAACCSAGFAEKIDPDPVDWPKAAGLAENAKPDVVTAGVVTELLVAEKPRPS